jgi:hypothetical protein
MRLTIALACLLVAGCGRYSDFSLPEPAGPPQNVRWTWHPQPDAVIRRGSAGKLDAVDALNPSVLPDGRIVYSGFDGRTWHTLQFASGRTTLIKSPDPKTWEGSYIAANGAALLENGRLLHWYQAGGRTPKIGLDGQIVLPLGPRGSWDERGVADPYVLRAGDWLYMFYLGQDRAMRQCLGVARSHDGLRWEKLRSNPVLELGPPGAFDENGLGEPAVWQSHGWWWMLYTGRDRSEHRRMGMARSRDGVRWERLPEPVIAGDQPWNAQVVCDPHVMSSSDPSTMRVWFGGGNVASPDENLNGQIGYGELKAVLE